MDSVEKGEGGAREAFPAPHLDRDPPDIPADTAPFPLWERGSGPRGHGGINRIGSGSYCNLRRADSGCSR